MANIAQFNSVLFNAWASGKSIAGTKDLVIFNGFWLLNETYVTTRLNVRNMPSINLLQVSNPKSDWGILLDRFYKDRSITIEGHIRAENYEEMQKKIDALKKAIATKQGYFEFKFGESYRRILCTLANSDIISRESYDVDHGKFTLTFRAEKPFWSEKQRGSVLFQGVNDEINGDVFNEGSEYSEPIINILVNSASGASELSIAVGKEAIKIAKNLNANDIIDINTEEKTVVINGQPTDFSGKFPKLQAGLNILNLKANGNYNLDVSVLFPKNFL